MKNLMNKILHALKTAGKAVWKALKFALRPFLWIARKTRSLAQRAWRSRKTHPAAWKNAVIASLAILLVANIALSAVFVAYSVRTRRDSEWAVYTVDSAVEDVRAVAKANTDRTKKTLERWKVRESVYTGTIGNNLTWEVNPESGTLTINGSGEMDRAYDEQKKPAFTMLYKDYIRHIVFGDGVKSIAPFAFTDFTALETVKLGADMEKICDYAFSGCTELCSVETENSSLVRIGLKAFDGCDCLTELFLPRTFESYSPMIDINRIRFTVDEDNADFTADDDGCLYMDDGETMLYCPVGVDTSYDRYPDYIIPTAVTKICKNCFNGNNINNLIIPGSVKSVCLDGSSMTWVDRLTLREGVEYLTSHYNVSDDFTHICTAELPDSLKKVNNDFFNTVRNVDCSESNPKLMKTKDGSIYARDGKVLYFVPEDESRTSLTVLEGTELIAEGATRNVSIYDATSISLPDTLLTIDNNNFNCITLKAGKTLTLPQGLERIGNHCFTSMTVTKIHIPDSVEHIGEDFLSYTDDTRCTEYSCKEGKTLVEYDGSAAKFHKICSSELPNGCVLQCADD